MQVKNQQLESNVEQWTGSKLEERSTSRPLCLFNLYAEYIKGKVGFDKAQAGIKIAGRNINLRYIDMHISNV